VLKERTIPVSVRIVLLSRLSLSATLIPFVVSAIPTIFFIVYVRLTVPLVVYIVPPASIVLMLIFVKEMCGKWSLISHISHLFLGDVPSITVSGPVAWAGLFLFLTAGLTAFFLIPAMVVYRPCHVNTE
jgi:hypothetical protein